MSDPGKPPCGCVHCRLARGVAKRAFCRTGRRGRKRCAGPCLALKARLARSTQPQATGQQPRPGAAAAEAVVLQCHHKGVLFARLFERMIERHDGLTRILTL
jgi:hypothetical protein